MNPNVILCRLWNEYLAGDVSVAANNRIVAVHQDDVYLFYSQHKCNCGNLSHVMSIICRFSPLALDLW